MSRKSQHFKKLSLDTLDALKFCPCLDRDSRSRHFKSDVLTGRESLDSSETNILTVQIFSTLQKRCLDMLRKSQHFKKPSLNTLDALNFHPCLCRERLLILTF